MSKLIVSAAVLASVFAGGMWVHAQTAPRITGQGSAIQPAAGTVIAGPDLGYRIESYKGTTPVGRLVVRIDGQWMAVEDSIVSKRLTNR